MAGIDFNRLRAEISMEQVLAQLSFAPTSRSGPQRRGPCPVHRSGSAGSRTFAVNIDAARYCCHKCRSSGNQLDLWAAATGLPIYEAAIDLCKSLGCDIPWVTRW